MFPQSFPLRVASGTCLILMLAGSGCATKRYVGKQVAPVDQRVTQVEKRTADQGNSIEGLQNDVSRSKERLVDLEGNQKQTAQRLEDTSNRTDQAAASALQAKQQATEARQYADSRSNRIEKVVENIDTFKLAGTAQVLFAIARSDLDQTSKSALDKIAAEAQSRKRFVFEVEGFTDSLGREDKNLALSQRRAEAVVRYLTKNHQIPLRAIHLMGTGSTSPVADNKTRDGRRQNRRVEIRLFAPEFDLSSSSTP
jgi:outer membrane protein OmpA-like peptidoglycan-associated protein